MEYCPITINTILYCKEWEKTVAFYRDQLKLPVLFSIDWFVEFSLNTMSKLSIADERRSSIQGCGGQGITLTMEVDDIEAVHAKLEAGGLNPTQIKKHPWNARVFHMVDPEGHRIEIWQAFAYETEPSLCRSCNGSIEHGPVRS